MAEKKLSKRRLIQLYSALLYNAHAKGFIKGDIYTGSLKSVCVPGLNCYSCPGAVSACPLGALQNALASSGKRMPFYIVGIILLFGLTLGRSICGYLCPFGLIQELLSKIPSPKLRKSRMTRRLSYIKYVILAVFVVILPLNSIVTKLPLPAFCKYICPAGTLEGALPLLMHPANADKSALLGGVFALKCVILIALIILCVFIHRCFCRFLCPLGALYGCFNKICVSGIEVDCAKCTGCGACTKMCEMDIRCPGDRECIECGKCMDVCPEHAIRRRYKVKSTRRTSAAAIIAAVLLFICVCAFVNRPDTFAYPETGCEVGCMCPDFQLTARDGSVIASSSLRGKVTVINFWATWCAPCVRELPNFDRLSKTRPDINVLAVHSNMVTDDVYAYWDEQGCSIDTLLDADGSAIRVLGGSTMLPMTVVLDKNGVIVYNAAGSLSYDALASIVEGY